MHEGRPPRVPDDLWAKHRVSELARKARRELVAGVDREREHVSHLVDPQVLALERPHLVRRDEVEPELPRLNPLALEHVAGGRGRRPRRSGPTPRPRSWR